MSQNLQLPAPHVGATKEIWDAINVDLQQILDDVSCWEGERSERMCTRLEAAIKRLNAAVGHEREGYGDAIALSYANDSLRERCEKLELVLAEKLSATTLLTGMNVGSGGIGIVLEGGAASLFAESFVQQYKESGAINYVEMFFTSKECMPGEKFVVTVQRVAGHTPHQLRVKAVEELAKAVGMLEDDAQPSSSPEELSDGEIYSRVSKAIDARINAQAVRVQMTEPMIDQLIGNWFADGWAKDAARGLLHDYDAAIATPQPAAELIDSDMEAMARADCEGDQPGCIDWTDLSNLGATAPQRAAFCRGARAGLAMQKAKNE